MNSYTTGQIIEMTGSFFNDQGGAADPTTVAVKYALSPKGSTYGTVTTLTYAGATVPAVGVVAKTATGVYEAQVDTTGMAAGWLTYEFVSTGTAQTVGSATVELVAAVF